MYTLYGLKLKKKICRKEYVKGLFGARFFEVLYFLECRLDILSLRAGLAAKSIESEQLIKKKTITVNGHPRNKSYIVCAGDIISRHSKNIVSRRRHNYK
jgi:ribosomal protein S4